MIHIEEGPDIDDRRQKLGAREVSRKSVKVASDNHCTWTIGGAHRNAVEISNSLSDSVAVTPFHNHSLSILNSKKNPQTGTNTTGILTDVA